MNKAISVFSIIAMVVAGLCFGVAITLVSIPDTFGMDIFQADKIGIKLMIAGTFMFPIGLVALVLNSAKTN